MLDGVAGGVVGLLSADELRVEKVAFSPSTLQEVRGDMVRRVERGELALV